MTYGSLTKSGTAMLIREVKNRPCLWDVTHEDYNVRSRTLIAWKQICNIMGKDFSVDFAKMRWKCIKDTFRRECKRFDPDDPDTYKGKWQYFRKMWFLKKGESVPKNDAPSVQDDEFEEEILINRIKREPSDDENEVFIEIDRRNIDGYANDRDEVRARPNDRILVDVDPILQDRREFTSNPGDEDFDMMFLKSLLPYFKNLDPMRKLVLRSKIQTLLVEEISGGGKK